MGLMCGDCGAPYSLEPEEAQLLSDRRKETPTLCPRCRAFQEGFQDESVLCTECGRVFIYPREIKLYAELFHWTRPRRCLGGCTRGGTRERTDEERHIYDFLRRLRAALRGGSGASISLSDMTRAGVRSPGPFDRAAPTKDDAKVGGSLADALKEFQARKRRSPNP